MFNLNLKEFKNRLANLNGENWRIIWEYDNFATENDKLVIYVRDWSTDYETDKYLCEVFIDKDLDDSFEKITQCLKSKNLNPSICSDALSFQQASELWGIDNSTIRKLLKRDGLDEGIDCKRIGSLWVISKYSKYKTFKGIKKPLPKK